ncbi:hypothetical protein CHM34_01230 [Paludifilum halophilum]|uniref:Uncharacterized protein n=1 Tax=Paludifilum halophilum TaxID=1642702 RepID=A0A235BBG9_9BACL|nr:hypothetical protein CHM34_01230 [Paludifilum halophilum]
MTAKPRTKACAGANFQNKMGITTFPPYIEGMKRYQKIPSHRKSHRSVRFGGCFERSIKKPPLLSFTLTRLADGFGLVESSPYLLDRIHPKKSGPPLLYGFSDLNGAVAYLTNHEFNLLPFGRVVKDHFKDAP